MTNMSASGVRTAGARTAEVVGVPARALLGGLCVAQAWMIVFMLKIGPVIAVLDARHGHGVHTGDLLAFPLLGVAMLLAMPESSSRASRAEPVRTRRGSPGPVLPAVQFGNASPFGSSLGVAPHRDLRGS